MTHMAIFNRREEWKSLLGILNDQALYQVTDRYASLVEMLEEKAYHTAPQGREAVQSVLDSYRFELDELRTELARRSNIAA